MSDRPRALKTTSSAKRAERLLSFACYKSGVGLYYAIIVSGYAAWMSSVTEPLNTIDAQAGQAGLQYLDYLGRTVPW